MSQKTERIREQLEDEHFSHLHPSITIDRIEPAYRSQLFDLENPGFCVKCGEEAYNCEPDARQYQCEHCGERTVYGAEEIFLRIL